jgi:phosphatidylglycerophosphatase C
VSRRLGGAASPGVLPGAGGAVVAVFDLDGTLAAGDTFVAYLLGALRGAPWRLLRCWHLPFAVALYKARLRDNIWLKEIFLRAILGGRREAQWRTWTDRFVNDLVGSSGLRPGALRALRGHQEAGHRTVLLSASPDLYVPLIATRLGFTDCQCTRLARDADGRLTGRLDGRNCQGPEKIARIAALLGPARAGAQVIAYGDHRTDLPLLAWADQGYLVNPAPALRGAPEAAGIPVVLW